MCIRFGSNTHEYILDSGFSSVCLCVFSLFFFDAILFISTWCLCARMVSFILNRMHKVRFMLCLHSILCDWDFFFKHMCACLCALLSINYFQVYFCSVPCVNMACIIFNGNTNEKKRRKKYLDTRHPVDEDREITLVRGKSIRFVLICVFLFCVFTLSPSLWDKIKQASKQISYTV